MPTAANVLRDARRRAGLSQRGVARLAGVHQPVIARIETGRERPSLETLERLIGACGYELRVDLDPEPDPGELSLLGTTLRLNPEERVDRLVALHRFATELRAAADAAKDDSR
ncbi:MAG: helix-turn-helix transcriptional regulator [Acidimicrobiales bacterium]